MGIDRYIKLGLHTMIFSLFGVGGLLFSCTNEVLIDNLSPDKDIHPKEADTYYNFVIQAKNETSGDAEGSAEENSVKNIAVIFFDKNEKYESKVLFDRADLVVEDGNGNLGSGVTGGLTFKKAIPITAGKKTVVAIVNCNDYIHDALNAVLIKGTTSFTDLYNYRIRLLPDGATYPSRLDLPKYDDYKAPLPSGYLALERIGIDDIQPSSFGMVMCGNSSIELEPGVTETEATAGQKNLVTIHVNRLQVKVSLSLDSRMGYGNVDGAALLGDNPMYQPESVVPITSAQWWLANIPAAGYLLEHETGNKHPYYDEKQDFSMWQNKWNKTKVGLDKTERSAYATENIVSTPLRGNTSYIVVKAKFSVNEISNDFVDNKKWFTYQWKWNQTQNTFDLAWVQGVPVGEQLTGTWVLTDTDKKRKIIPCQNNKDWQVVMDYLNYKISSTANTPVRQIRMTAYNKEKLLQDAAVINQGSEPLITAGWYAFCYDAKEVHSNKWFDEIELYYYTGEKDAAGNWVREFEDYITGAYYDENYCYYRINLQDITQPSTVEERYAVHRNDWFKVTVNKFKEIGYPDEEDLAANPEDKLSESWLEVEISVQKWRNGGNQDEIIGK